MISDSNSGNHACKSHTVSAENYLYLLVTLDLVTDNNSVEIIIPIWKNTILKLIKVFVK